MIVEGPKKHNNTHVIQVICGEASTSKNGHGQDVYKGDCTRSSKFDN